MTEDQIERVDLDERARDLVERLRAGNIDQQAATAEEAADKIERLSRALADQAAEIKVLSVRDIGWSLQSEEQAAEIARLREHVLAAPSEREQWQDIASAPKDGTDILLTTTDADYSLVGYWDDGAFKCSRDMDAFWPQPTHWMPLLQPPGTDAIPTPSEREQIVAWIKSEIDKCQTVLELSDAITAHERALLAEHISALEQTAAAIERGDHLRESERD